MSFSKRDLAALIMVGGSIPTHVFAVENVADYPQRPITLIIGTAPGGGTDILARRIAAHMTADLGQNVIVEYRPGASGNIAALPEAISLSKAHPGKFSLATIQELGYGEASADDWFAIMAPARTPAQVITRLNRSVNRALAAQGEREQLSRLGFVAPASAQDPATLAALIAEDTRKWTAILAAWQIKGLQ